MDAWIENIGTFLPQESRNLNIRCSPGMYAITVSFGTDSANTEPTVLVTFPMYLNYINNAMSVFIPIYDTAVILSLTTANIDTESIVVITFNTPEQHTMKLSFCKNSGLTLQNTSSVNIVFYNLTLLLTSNTLKF